MVHKTALQMHLQGQQNKHTSSKCRHSARYLEPNCSGFDLMDATASSQNERHAMPSSCHDRLGGGGGGGCKRIQASLPSTASQYRSPARLSHSSIHQCWHAGTSFLTRSRCVQPVFMKHGINDADSVPPPPPLPLCSRNNATAILLFLLHNPPFQFLFTQLTPKITKTRNLCANVRTQHVGVIKTHIDTSANGQWAVAQAEKRKRQKHTPGRARGDSTCVRARAGVPVFQHRARRHCTCT